MQSGGENCGGNGRKLEAGAAVAGVLMEIAHEIYEKMTKEKISEINARDGAAEIQMEFGAIEDLLGEELKPRLLREIWPHRRLLVSALRGALSARRELTEGLGGNHFNLSVYSVMNVTERCTAKLR